MGNESDNGMVSIRLEEDGKPVPFDTARLEVATKWRADLDRAVALLKRIQWNGADYAGAPQCPECGGERPPGLPGPFGPFKRANPYGHAPRCELAALIA